MDNSAKVFFFLLGIIGLCVLGYFKVKNYTDELNAENSFLKRAKSFKIKWLDIVDFEFCLAVFFLFSAAYLLFKSAEPLALQLFHIAAALLLVGFILFGLAFIQLYSKWVFYRQAQDILYTFDPAAQTFSTKGGAKEAIFCSFSQIQQIDYYRLKGKMPLSFALIRLKSKKVVLVNQESAFYSNLSIFFEDLEQNFISLSLGQYLSCLHKISNNKIDEITFP